MILKGDGLSRLVSGRLIKDAVHKTVGAKSCDLTKLAVAYNNDRNDPNGIINVTAWFELAARCAGLKKGDRVIVTGDLKSSESNGKTYWELEADCITVSPNNRVVMQDEAPEDGFTDVQDDDLPF